MKILLIRFKHIGDVLITSTLCASLKQSFPTAQIDCLVHANSAPLFDNNPCVDNVIALDAADRGPVAYLAKIWRVTRNRYDIIIDATSTGRSELVSWLSPSAKFRIGRRKGGRGLAYTHRVANKHDNKIEQRLELLGPLVEAGYEINYERKLRLFVTDSEISAARARMRQAGIGRSDRVFAFAVSSARDYRFWNLDYMEQVVRHCLDRHHANILLLPGVPAEQERIDDFRQRFAPDARVFSNVTAVGLRDLFAVLSQCHLFVGNEGGPRHFAEAVGLPSVCVFSPSADLAEWLPELNSRHQAIEWRSVFAGDREPQFTDGDQLYRQLYDLIKPGHVTRLIDQVVHSHLDSPVQDLEPDLP